MQKMILALHVDRIDAINGRDWKAPGAIWWDPEMVFDDQEV
jgi:hypothetical protein